MMSWYGRTNNFSVFVDVRTFPTHQPSRSSYVDNVGRAVMVAASEDAVSAGATSVSAAAAACDGDAQLYSTPTTVVLAVVFTLLAVATIAGNTLVVVAFATDAKLRSFGNYFILNLAVSDLVVGTLIAVYAPYALTGCWTLTRAGCLTFLLLDYVVPLASAWNMALISLDRYWSVAHAVDYRVRQTVRRAVALMAVPWTAGVVWYGPTVLFWSALAGRAAAAADDDGGVCRVPFHDHVGYLIASSCVEFAAPFFTVTAINVLIYVNIRRRSRGLVSAAALVDSAGGGDVGLCSKTSKARLTD